MNFLRSPRRINTSRTIFINERVIGLPTERYTEKLICPGDKSSGLTRAQKPTRNGSEQQISVPAGNHQYLQVYETNDTDFGVREISEDQVKDLSKGLSQSHVINRHQPICNVIAQSD